MEDVELFWQQVPDAWTVWGSLLVIGGGLLTVFLARPARGET